MQAKNNTLTSSTLSATENQVIPSCSNTSRYDNVHFWFFKMNLSRNYCILVVDTVSADPSEENALYNKSKIKKKY